MGINEDDELEESKKENENQVKKISFHHNQI